jgi:hypothetical protein
MVMGSEADSSDMIWGFGFEKERAVSVATTKGSSVLFNEW